MLLLEERTASMKSVADRIIELSGDIQLPVFNVFADDNIASSVVVRGTFDPKNGWENGLFQNSRYFIFFIRLAKNYRWNDMYHEGDNITIKLLSKLEVEFPEFTGTPDEAVNLMIQWIKDYQ